MQMFNNTLESETNSSNLHSKELKIYKGPFGHQLGTTWNPLKDHWWSPDHWLRRTTASDLKGDDHRFSIINYVIYTCKRLWMKISTILPPSVESRTWAWPHSAWCHWHCKKGNAHECSHPLEWRILTLLEYYWNIACPCAFSSCFF